MDERIERFREPLTDEEIEWRVQRSGLKNGKPWAVVVPYINWRSAMQRLDDCFGPDGWQSQCVEAQKGIIATISIQCGQWISKSDGGSYSKIEEFKGGISDAFKRVCVQWGLGRELYDLKNVWIGAQDIREGYPPDDNPRAVPIVIMQNGKAVYRGWCEAPRISDFAKDDVSLADLLAQIQELCQSELLDSQTIADAKMYMVKNQNDNRRLAKLRARLQEKIQEANALLEANTGGEA